MQIPVIICSHLVVGSSEDVLLAISEDHLLAIAGSECPMWPLVFITKSEACAAYLRLVE